MLRPELHISSLPLTLNLSQYHIGVTKHLHLSNPELKSCLQSQDTSLILNNIVHGRVSIREPQMNKSRNVVTMKGHQQNTYLVFKMVGRTIKVHVST